MKKITTVTKKITSLKDLIDSTEWVTIQARTGPSKLPEDAVSVNFTFKSAKSINDKENTNCDLLRIRLGREVLEKLDWVITDRIYISHHPDDYLTFLLCKVSSKNGYKLSKDFGTASASIQITWPKENLAMKPTGSYLVEYEIHKGKLIFRANPPE